MKSLKPSQREDKRYLLVSGNNLRENIEKAILDFVGVLGMSKTGLDFIKTDKNSAIISVNFSLDRLFLSPAINTSI